MRARLQLFSGLLAVLVGGSTGCARVSLEVVRADVAAGHGHLVATVPFIAQEAYQCGPASVAMVLRYYGVPADEDAIARELYLPSARGTLNLELEFYARRLGFETRTFASSLTRLKEELRRGRPLIVFQDLAAAGGAASWPVPHFAVLLGYDDRTETVVLHSGTTSYRVVPYAEFERARAARGHWTLLILPAGQAG